MTSDVNRKKFSGFELLSIFSSIGIIGCIIGCFLGGSTFFMLLYGPMFLILLVYIVSAIETLVSLLQKGMSISSVKLFSHGLVFITIILSSLYESETFKSDRIMTAVLKDDLFNYRLIFREDGTVENQINGVFAYYEIQFGKYTIQNDTIVFSINPYDNDFIPDTLLMDKKNNALFFNLDENGKFNTEKTWLNYFEIE